MKHGSEGIQPGFETQGRRHQKSKTGLSVAPQKGLLSSKNFKKKSIPVGCVPPARYRTGGLCPGGSLLGGLCWGDLCLGVIVQGSLSERGSLSRGVSVGGNLCLCLGGNLCLGGLCPGYVSVRGRVSVWGVSVRGVSVRGSLRREGSVQRGGLPDRPPREQNHKQM